MPENARVFVVEDTDRWRERVEKYLNESGHSIVARAQTRAEALAKVPTLRELQVDVVTLDGQLDHSSSDGPEILGAILERYPDMKTVGLSLGTIYGVTIDLGKDNIHELGEVVRRL